MNAPLVDTSICSLCGNPQFSHPFRSQEWAGGGTSWRECPPPTAKAIGEAIRVVLREELPQLVKPPGAA